MHEKHFDTFVYLILLYLLFFFRTISEWSLFSGDILEVGAQWAIARKDIPAFERYMAQLKCYYMDYK